MKIQKARALKIKAPKVKDFVRECLAKGITSPSEMKELYKTTYGREKSAVAFTMAMRRMDVTAKQRLELKAQAQKQTEIKDISEYDEWKHYLSFADFSQIGQRQKQETAQKLRTLWEWMGGRDPREWKFVEGEDSLIAKLKEKIGQNEKGQWNSSVLVLNYLGAYNRVFQGYLPKGWSMGLKRPAGELKDFLEVEVFQEFIHNLSKTEELSREGWTALYNVQVTVGCREGATRDTGILSLKWEDINYETQRCKIRDKGEKGHPARLWIDLPLQLFPWVQAFQTLMNYHNQRFGYVPSNSRRESGKVFPISYESYRRQFHNTRHLCKNEFATDNETHVPHIMRKTHAQWCRRIGISLDNICGDTDSTPSIGRYGVGWTDRNIPAKYYITKEPWEYEEQDNIIKEHLVKLVKPEYLCLNNMFGLTFQTLNI